jgi:hypothetical protein
MEMLVWRESRLSGAMSVFAIFPETCESAIGQVRAWRGPSADRVKQRE